MDTQRNREEEDPDMYEQLGNGEDETTPTLEDVASGMPGAGRLHEDRHNPGESDPDTRPDTQAPAG